MSFNSRAKSVGESNEWIEYKQLNDIDNSCFYNKESYPESPREQEIVYPKEKDPQIHWPDQRPLFFLIIVVTATAAAELHTEPLERRTHHQNSKYGQG